MKNQAQDNEQQVLRNETESNNVQGDNESLVNELIDFVRGGKFKEIKTIVDKLSIEQFKEVVKAYTNSDRNLFHYVAERRVLDTLDLIYSKLADRNLALNLLKEKDENNFTPYNIAQRCGNDKFCQKILSIIWEGKALKEEILNEAVVYQYSKELEEGLAEKTREEIKNNKDGIPHFHNLERAVEWDCTDLTREILDKLQESQIDKKLFFEKPGYHGCNLFHFAAEEGNVKILKYLYNFDPSTAKKLFDEENDEGMTPYKVAFNNGYNEFCTNLSESAGKNFRSFIKKIYFISLPFDRRNSGYCNY